MREVNDFVYPPKNVSKENGLTEFSYTASEP